MTTMRCAALIVVLGLLSHDVAAQPASDALHLLDDVQTLDLSRLAPTDVQKGTLQKGTFGSATDRGDRDNISVISLVGDYARDNPQPRLDLARTFLDSHADEFDFLVVFTSFEFPTGDALAFYNPVFNDVQGIGIETFDHREAYGGSRRLQGYIDMAAMSRYDFNTRSPEYRSPLDTLTHEIMHRWSVRLRYEDPGGQLSDDLIGRGGMHWSLGASTDASLMYGARWSEGVPGTWAIVESRRRLGTWDLYLAGLLDPGELTPIPLIRAAAIDPMQLPVDGFEVEATSELISPAQIIAAQGERMPAAGAAQSHFNGAIMLVLRPGEDADPIDLARLERFRVAYEQYFQAITRGRATISFQLRSAPAHQVAAPPVLPASPIAPQAQPLDVAAQWLASRQMPAGHWQDRTATAARDTTATLEFLEDLGGHSAAVATGRSWLLARPAANADEEAWIVRGSPSRPFPALAVANPDGGLGLLPGWLSSPLDSARALDGHEASRQRDEASIATLAAYLQSQQNPDGSIGPTAGGRGSVPLSILTAAQLLRREPGALRDAGIRTRDWLQSLLNPGSISAGSFSLSEVAELSLGAPALQLSSATRTALAQYLLANQGQDGDFGGSVHTTSVAALALLRELRPNLVAVTGSVTPASPVVGDWMRLRVRVANRGGQVATATALRWYDADPAQAPGSEIASVAVPPMLPGDERTLDAWIEAEAPSGPLVLYAMADADLELAEGREDDNVVAVPMDIATSPAAVDLALDARDLHLTPVSLSQVPATVQLSGRVRNLGLTPATAVLLRAFDVTPDGETFVLAEASVDVGATTSAAFLIELPVTQARAHRIRLVADPMNAIDEARESNNQAEVVLPIDSAIDLELLGSSLVVNPTAPVLGDDLTFRITVANRGTGDSPVASLVLERNIAGDWERIAETTLSVPAGQQVMRELGWRPLAEGETGLRLRVDPDSIVTETNEDNNEHAFTVDVGRSTGANLIVVPASITVAPEPVLQGAPLQLSATVRNLGAAAAPAFNVAVYRGDPRSAGQRLGATRVEAGLSALSDAVVMLQVPDYGVSGDASLFVHVDSELEVDERNENDNVGIRNITSLSMQDLSVTLAAVELTPSAPVFGQSVAARISVSNLGEQASSPSVAMLSELAGTARAGVDAGVAVPALPPGGSFVAEWSWTFGLIEGTQALSVVLDPDNRLRESNELNNEVTLLLDTQSGDAFATDVFFSPNGDGIKDQTRVVWREGAQVAQVRVTDHGGRERRRIAGIEDAGNGAAAIVWDGRDDAGRVLSDGRYAVVAYAADGGSQPPVYVVLDTDQPMALEAVNSQDGIFRELPASVNPWVFMPDGSPAEDQAYVVGHEDNPHSLMQRGVARFNVLVGGLEAVLTAGWLDRYVQTNGLVDLELAQVRVLSDGRLLLAAHEMGGEHRTLLFALVAGEVDNPMLLASVPSRALDPLLGQFDALRVLVGDGESGGLRWVVDLGSGSATPLSGSAPAGRVVQVLAEGVVIGSEFDPTLEFVPVDPMRPTIPLPHHGYRMPSRIAFTADGRRYILHEQQYSEYDEYGAEEIISVVDVTSGTRRELIRVEVPYAGDYINTDARKGAEAQGTWRRLRMLSANWLEHRDEITVVDHASSRVLRFARDGSPVGQVELPPVLRADSYSPGIFGIDAPVNEVFAAEIATPSPECGLSAHGDWLAIAGSRLGVERQRFDAESGSVYLTTGEVVWGGDNLGGDGGVSSLACEGAVDYLRVGLDGDSDRLGGSTLWPLESAQDAASYPALQHVEDVAIPPAVWPAFIHRNGSMLRSDTRVYIPSQGRLTTTWPFASRLRDISASQTRLHLAAATAPRQEQRTAALFSTLEKLTAVLGAGSDGRTVMLSGVATDRNFDHFRIDWAFASTPDAWNVLVPATRDEVRFDDFLGWAPPQAGAYVFRLRVVDRAGNVREKFASADVETGSPISNLRQDHRAISPNGDAVQDSLTLSFSVTRPTEQRFEIRDLAGRVMYFEDRVYGTPELGANTWNWDGRNNAGVPVPEGRYRVELSSGHVLRVNVDITPPVVTAALTLPVAQFGANHLREVGGLDGMGPTVSYRIADVFDGGPGTFQLYRLESSPLDRSEWSELQPYAEHIGQTAEITAALSSRQYVDRRFRAVAVDAAGNRTERIAGNSQAALLLLHADLLRENMPAFQPLPHGSVDGIPLYLVPDPSRPASVTPIRIGADLPLFALDLRGDAQELIVDELTSPSPGAAMTWVTRHVRPPLQPRASDDVVPAFLAGSVLRTPVDLAGRDPGSHATLRLRTRYGDGTELTSNAVQFLLGGITLECPPLGGNFEATTYLQEPVTDVSLELADANFVIRGRVREVTSRHGNVLAFAQPQQSHAFYRVSATDSEGRSTSSRWVSCQTGIGSGGNGQAVALVVVPSFSATCDETPSGAVRVDASGLVPLREYRLAVRSPFLATAYERSLQDANGISFDLDVSQWPAADYRLRLEERRGEQWPWSEVATAAFVVDHTAPVVDLLAPASGARYCANASQPPELQASIADDRMFGYLVDHRAAGTTQAFVQLEPPQCGGLMPATPGSCPRIETGRLTGFSLRQRADYVGALQTPATFSGAETRIRATDWSGAQVCRAVQHSIDAVAQIEERSAPLPLSPSNTLRFPAIAPGSDGDHRRGRWFLRAREPLGLQVQLYRATATTAAPGAVAIGDSIATLATVSNLSGEYDFAWDGLLGGTAAEDGLYVLRFLATDDCGNQKQLDRPVVLDSTPPTVALTQPAANAQLRVATLQVAGTADDPQFGSYRVELSQASAEGPWQILADDTRPVPQPALLAQWPTSGALGPLWIRLSASDWLGNSAQMVRAVELLPRELVLQDARIEPALFSPNADSRLDTAAVLLQLRVDALLDVRVLDLQGSPLRTLRSGVAAAAGPVAIVWDGRNDGGDRVADGDYVVDVRATDAAVPGSTDTQALAVGVDTVAPSISDVTPPGDIAGCNATASFTLAEPMLDRFSSRLLRGDSTIATRTGRAAGSHVVHEFTHLPEADYRFEIEAHDLAGNRADVERDFTLDCTAPDAVIASPEPQAVVPRAVELTVPVIGSAFDQNLLRHTLDIAPANAPQSRTTLIENTQPVQDSLLLGWQPAQADGDYVLRLQVEDRAGNSAETSVPLRVDGTPPVAAIDFPQPGEFVRESLNMYGTASDENLASYRIELATPEQAAQQQWVSVNEGTQSRTQNFLGNVAFAHEGEVVIRLLVTDLAGLTSSAQVQVTVDAQPPPAPLALAGTLEDRRNVRLLWQGSDVSDLDDFQILRNGQEVGRSSTRAFIDPDVPEGELTYRVVAFDLAGNESAPSNAVTLRVDRTPPAVAIFTPAAHERLRGIYPISGLAFSDSDFGEYRLELLASDGSVLEQLRRSSSAVSGGLLHTWDTRGITDETALRLRLIATDTSGNEAEAVVPVVVDNAPPAAPTGLVAVDAGADVELGWDPNIESDLLGYLLYRGGQLLGASGSLPADLRPLAQPQNDYTDAGAPDGELSYRVYAIDRAGNLSAPSQPASLIRDAGPPTLRIVRPQAGESFSDAIEVLAQSDDRDIAQVAFSWRAVGEPHWTSFGDIATSIPWRATFEAGGLEHGEFELRAVATDFGAQVDPAPPTVIVRYADVTPPDSPTQLIVRADGETVSIGWQASEALDLAGYRVERQAANGQWQALQSGLFAGTSAVDADRPVGMHAYRVVAIDTSGNASVPSATDSAHVFALTLHQPYTPTAAASLMLGGRSSNRGGTLHYRVSGESGTTDGEAHSIAAHTDFELGPVPIPPGLNLLEVRIVDADGNRSIAAQGVVRRGDVPLPPTGLSGSINGFDVTLDWAPSPSVDVSGYRVYRNDRAIATDARLAQSIAANAPGGTPAAAVDGDLGTAWSAASPIGSPGLGGTAVLTLDWPAAALVSGVRMRFDGVAAAASEYRVFALDADAGWILLGTRVDRERADELMLFDFPRITRGLRIEFVRVQAPGAVLRLLEVEPLERTLVPATSAIDQVTQGRHEYRVSAVSSLGFESEHSAPWTAEIGDVQAPPAVVLSGVVANGSPVLNWTESLAPDLAGYVLYRDAQPVAEIPAAQVRQWTDTGLANGEYVYTVTARDLHDNQSSHSNAIALQVAADVPGQPTIISVAQPDQAFSLRVTWMPGAGPLPSLYHLHVATEASGPYSRLLSLAGSEYLHQGLLPGQRYFYQVEAADEHGNRSVPSAPVGALVVDTLPPLMPRLTYPTVPGTPILLAHPGFDACGYTSPAASVIVARNADAAGEATARAGWSQRELEFATDYAEAAVSGDGRSVFVSHAESDNRAGWFDLASGQRVAQVAPQFEPVDQIHALGRSNRAAAASPDGEILVLARDTFEAEDSGRFGFGPSLVDFAPDAEGDRVVALGNYDAQGDGLWIVRQRFQNFERIDLPPGRTARTGSLHWTAAGDSVLFADQSGQVHRLDAEMLSVSGLATPAIQSGPFPAPHAAAWIGIDASGRLLRFDADNAPPAVLLDDGRRPLALAWSPDGLLLALRFVDSIELRDASTGALLDSVAAALLDDTANYRLQWSASWTLLLQGDAGRRPELIEIPGSFCARGIQAFPGVQYIQAVAQGANGLLSLPSDPIQIELEQATTRDIDLQVGRDDLRLFPEGARTGDQLVAYVVLRNLGTDFATLPPDRFLRAELTRPDGSVQIPVVAGFDEMDPGSTATIAIDLGRATAVGDYTLSVEADPESVLIETDESNNSASRTWSIDVVARPQLSVSSERSVYAPGEVVRGQVEVSNPGTLFQGDVVVHVLDADGGNAIQVGQFALPALATGQSRRFDWQWTPEALANGSQGIRATLRSGTGATLQVRSTAITIEARAELALLLQPVTAAPVSGTALPIQIGVDYTAGNQVLESGQLRLISVSPGGNQQLLWQGATGLLLPGYSLRRSVTWPANTQAPGDYTLRLEFSSGALLLTRTSPLRLRDPAANDALVGTLNLQPSTQLVLGSNASTLHLRATNASAANLTATQLRVLVRAEGEAVALIEQGWTVDLAAGASSDQVLPITGLPDQVRAYSAQLQARLATDPPGTWRMLDTLGFNAIDGIAPEITLIAPTASAPHRSPVGLAARISDHHSRVKRAWYRIDGGSWRSLPAGGVDGYEALLHGLSDGEHAVELRAQDLWGNESALAAHRFIVDSTPPVISIDGVLNGQLGNQPVTAVIGVVDAHPDITRSWLDNAPYVSGAPIQTEGAHEILVIAHDLAGNRAERRVGFTIDRSAPTLDFVAPADGTRTTADSIDVRLSSEAGARIRLVRGAFEAQADADAAGHVLFIAVPLQVGDNLMQATATDAAQNESAAVPLTVVREALSGELTGQLQPALAQLPRGQDLALQIDVDNGTADAIDPLALRLRAFDSGAALLLQEDIPIALASGASLQLQRVLAAAGWDFGPVSLVLDADAGQGYQLLDTATVTVVDIQPPQLAPIVPGVGSVQPRPTTLRVSITDEQPLAATEYRIDGGEWSSLDNIGGDVFGASVSLADGGYDLQYRARDVAGNTGFSESIAFVVDGTAPQITVDGVADTAIYNQPVTAVITVLDANPATLSALLNGSAYASGTPITGTGEYTLELMAEDAAGNQSARTIEFEIDLEPPTVEFVTPLPDAIIATDRVLVVGTTEPGSSVRLVTGAFEATVLANAAGSFNVPDVPLLVGENLLVARATDRAGNLGLEASLRVFHSPGNPIGLDGSIIAVPHEVAAGASFELQYLVNERAGAARSNLPLRIELRALGASEPLQTINRSIDLAAGQTLAGSELLESATLALGTYVANLAVQVDGDWNELGSDAMQIVDRTVPVVELLAPPADSVHRDTVGLLARASDEHGIATVQARVESGAWEKMVALGGDQWQHALALPQEGPLLIEVRARDVHGNLSAVAAVAILSDQTAPAIAISGVTDGQSSRLPLTPQITVTDASAVTVESTLNGFDYVSGTPVSAQGEYVLRVVARDVVDNLSERTLSFSIDTTAPAVLFVQPQDGAHVSAERIDVLGSTEANAQVTLVLGAIQRNVVANGKGGFVVTDLALNNGYNLIRARATDRAGNVGEWSQITVLRACGTADLGCSLFADGFEGSIRGGFESRAKSYPAPKGSAPTRPPILIPMWQREVTMLTIVLLLITALLQPVVRGRPS